ncbi:MAG: hypothetical protein MH321_06535 [Leptospiraceae bacterium]|nr:hypothetical protein [Leptospiraceae bacterium]
MTSISLVEHREFYRTKLKSFENKNVYSIFKEFSPILAERNFFQHLKTNESLDYIDFLNQIRALAMHPTGLGLALSAMPEVNLCGNILVISNKVEILNQLCDGRKIISMAVSEKGWKGRLKNMKTTFLENNTERVLVGSKGFATNGRNPDYYLILAKIQLTYEAYLLPFNTVGLEINPFDLNYAREATHAEIHFHQIPESKLIKLDMQYNEYAKTLRILEMFSFQFILLGFIDRIRNEKSMTIELKQTIVNFENEIQAIIDRLKNQSRFTLNSKDLKWGSTVVETLQNHLPEIKNYSEWELFKILLPKEE